MAKTFPGVKTPPPWLDYVDAFNPEHKDYDPTSRVQYFKNGGKDVHWQSNVGPQTWLQYTIADETLIGGKRGGSKSQGLIAWFASGDLRLPDFDPARVTYLNDPSYRGLMLRKEYQAMAEFLDEAMEFFGPFGCKAVDDPVQFVFKSGAIIYTNHLQDPKAFEKYRGWGLTRIGIEELTQIEKEQSYIKLLGSLRAKKMNRMFKGRALPPLFCQIMASTNPDGPGAPWVKGRFVRLTSGGEPILWNSLVRNPITKLTRVFIPMGLEDNPYYADNKQYMGMLLEQDEVTQRQWIHGDWDAAAGSYFRAFRPNGPAGPVEAKETPWANHVIDKTELRPYWYRFGGGDWGYQHKSVFHKGCKNERDGRIHIYDEMSVSQVGSFELGVLVAKWWLPDLEGLPDKKITLALSPDAFNKTDANKTRAEQFAEGIRKVLGPYGAFLMKFNDDERAAMERNPQYAQKMFRARMDSQPKGQLAIGVKPANNSRIDGWQYIVDLLRFRPVVSETEDDIRVRLQATFRQMGVEAYERELSRVNVRGKEVLPRLHIWKRCTELIRGLQDAMHDDPPRAEDVRKFDAVDGVGGDDGLDACFIAGTLIKTSHGMLPIELVRIGEYVQTRAGLRRVLCAGVTGSKRTITVRFSDGSYLTGTPDHPVFSPGKGFISLDSLRYTERNAAPVFVLGKTEGPIAPVYNLTVEGQPEYFANGILVHNCRYTLMNFKEVSAMMPKSYWITEEMERIQSDQVESFGEAITDPTRLAMISMAQSARFDKLHGSKGNPGFTFPRAGSSLHRR